MHFGPELRPQTGAHEKIVCVPSYHDISVISMEEDVWISDLF